MFVVTVSCKHTVISVVNTVVHFTSGPSVLCVNAY